MSTDFTLGSIDIRYSTDNFGPFTFEFENSIPSGDSIASVAVAAYSGNVKPKSTLSDFTEITDLLIDTDVAPSVFGSIVSVYFSYPGDDYKGTKATLIFTLTFNNNTGVHPYYFRYVHIK